MRVKSAAAIACLILFVGCADPAFEMYLENPCDQPVDFTYDLVQPGGHSTPGSAEVIPVAPHGSEKVLEATIHLEDNFLEVLVTVVGLPDYEERWAEPVDRTFTFDRSLCSQIADASAGL